jgi:acyl-CoA thioesterase YciA
VTRAGRASHQPPGLALPAGKIPALRVVPMPADANHNGDIFGGWIMAQVDVAGGTVAGRMARGRVATVSVNSFVFKQPVQIGDILSLYADVVRVGNTSITVNVEVFAERGRGRARIVKVTEATLTYVAIDSSGRPRPVPKWASPRSNSRRATAIASRAPCTAPGRRTGAPSCCRPPPA